MKLLRWVKRYCRFGRVQIGLTLCMIVALTSVALASPIAAQQEESVHATLSANPAGEGGDNGEPVTHDPAYTRRDGSSNGAHEVILAPVEIQASAVYTQVEIPIPVIPDAPNTVFIPLVAGGSDTISAAGIQVIPKKIDMKILVIAATGEDTETDFAATTSFLEQIGIPYDVILAVDTPLTWDMLSNGVDHGYYQGIILITGNLAYFNDESGQWESALDGNEWWTLWTYERLFGVRQVTAYTYPGGWPDTYGLTLVDPNGTGATVQATLTDAGKEIYPYLNPASSITFTNTWLYKATATDAATVPLLTTSEGHAVAAIHTYANGRQNLAITAANNPNLTHSLLLSYGTINWLTKGLFLGSRHVTINFQIDDLLIENDMWDTVNMTETVDGSLTFRISDQDFANTVPWQNNLRSQYPLANSEAPLTLEWAFNGEGAEPDYWGTPPNLLANSVAAHKDAFFFVSHTYTHANLDNISYTDAMQELALNHAQAATLGLTNGPTTYYPYAMVQPDVSGLGNPEFLRAAKDFGMKYMVSDTSRPGWTNPSHNAGIYSAWEPSILIIPRRPANLYYNVSTPEEWVSEYNYFYAPGGLFPWWDHPLTYEELLDKESEVWLHYMLKWDLDPLMFHQANLRTYPGQAPGGVRSLLGDLIEATVAKYTQKYNLPILGLAENQVGERMSARMVYNNSGVTATLGLAPCAITLTTVNPAVIPVTGDVQYTGSQEVYGGQTISYVGLETGQSVTLPINPELCQ